MDLLRHFAANDIKLLIMSQRYPSYPSEDKYTPSIYHIGENGQQIRHKQKYQGPYIDDYNGNNLQSRNYTNPWTNQELDLGNQQENYEQVLKQTLCYETCANIENMIHSNCATIHKLKKNNQMLRQHLSNLRKIFSKKPMQKKQRFQTSFQQSSEKPQKYVQQTYEENFIQRDFQTSTTDKNHQKNIAKRQKEAQIQLEQEKVKTQSNESRKIFLPSKVRYTQESWVKEQYHTQQFLHSFMKHNIQATPFETMNVIEKRKILDMYLKWRRMNKLGKSELAPFKIQQIITNEIKAVFGCTCTARDYVGMLLNYGSESNEIKGEKMVDKADDIVRNSERKNLNAIPVIDQGEERFDEEFSIGQSEGEIKIEDNYVYF